MRKFLRSKRRRIRGISERRIFSNIILKSFSGAKRLAIIPRKMIIMPNPKLSFFFFKREIPERINNIERERGIIRRYIIFGEKASKKYSTNSEKLIFFQKNSKNRK